VIDAAPRQSLRLQWTNDNVVGAIQHGWHALNFVQDERERLWEWDAAFLRATRWCEANVKGRWISTDFINPLGSPAVGRATVIFEKKSDAALFQIFVVDLQLNTTTV
jgi:hypothetical protein